MFASPLPLDVAMADVEYILSLPNVRAGAETAGYWDTSSDVLREAEPSGNLISGAHIVGLMRQHEVRRILTHDRDFRKFDGSHVIDPFA